MPRLAPVIKTVLFSMFIRPSPVSDFGEASSLGASIWMTDQVG
jgi:hypothetical protein